MHVHLVFVTKYRRGVFTKEVIDDLREVSKAFAQTLKRNWLSSMAKTTTFTCL